MSFVIQNDTRYILSFLLYIITMKFFVFAACLRKKLTKNLLIIFVHHTLTILNIIKQKIMYEIRTTTKK